MSDTFNMRNPEHNEVSDIMFKAREKRRQVQRYKVIKQLLDGKTADLTISPELFEAYNRERMEFEDLLKLHPDQARDCEIAAKEDRELTGGEKHWNPKSSAKWGILGHIPPCIFYSRPAEYWENEKIIKAFFNTFTKFRISGAKL